MARTEEHIHAQRAVPVVQGSLAAAVHTYMRLETEVDGAWTTVAKYHFKCLGQLLRMAQQDAAAQPPQQCAQPVAWMRDDGMKAMVDDEKQGWISAGRTELVEGYTNPLVFAVAPPVEAPYGPLINEGRTEQPLMDAEIQKLWGDLQARKIKEARAAHADQLDKLCGVCGLGSYRLDNNGYNSFLRCDQCRNVPMYVDGIDLSAGKNLAEFVRAKNGIKPISEEGAV